jgi:serine/threonine-protein kinase
MVMERLEGRTLADELAARRTLPQREALEILGQMCEALACCHKKNVVHRDLGPHNVFLAQRAGSPPLVKLIDFGIVKVSGALASKKDLTGQGAVMGSPQHIPPEQMVSAANVDQRGDIWSAGSVLFTMLAGHPPFQGDTLPMLCTQVMKHPTPSIRSIRPDLDEGIERVVMRCMEKERDGRYRDVGQLVDALLPFAPELASHATEVHRILEDAVVEPLAPKRANKVVIAAVGTALLIAIVLVALRPW